MANPRTPEDLYTIIGDLEERLRRIEKSMQNEWTPFAFDPDWTEYHTSWGPGGYQIDGSGFVHLRGLVKPASVAQGAGAILTLPQGFRSENHTIQSVLHHDGTGHGFSVIQILNDGTVYLAERYNLVGTAVNIGTGGWVSLHGLTFRAYQ